MNIEFHCLSWTNNNPKLQENHKKVFSHFNIPMNYTVENIHHGKWMNEILNTRNPDVFVFFDIDCVLMNMDVINESIELCQKNYLIGNAQVTNCIKAKHDLFCAPSFFVISKKMYEYLGKPNPENNRRSDVGQEITRSAVDMERRIKMYFPTSFQEIPVGGIWRLSSYGYYGIGTIYDEKIYHLYQARFQKNLDLFEETCNHIIAGKLDQINRKYNSRHEWMNVLPIEDDYGN